MGDNLYLNHVVPECQITKSTKRGINANIDLKEKKTSGGPGKYSIKLMCTVVFLKESDANLRKLNKQYKSLVSTRCTTTYVSPLTLSHLIHGQTALPNIFKKNSSIKHSIQCPSVTTVGNKIGWKAKIKRRGGENGTSTNVTSDRRHVSPPMIVIR